MKSKRKSDESKVGKLRADQYLLQSSRTEYAASETEAADD